MTLMTLASEAALPHVLQLPPQLPHIVGVLGGASRDTRTTKGVVSHANDWKEEEAHGPQSSGQGRSAQDQEAQGSQEKGRPEERKEVYENLNQPKQLVIYNNSGPESLCKKEHLKWLASVSAFLNS